MPQEALFQMPINEPQGFRYKPEFLTQDEEKMLLSEFSKITLEPYVFEGYEAKRRIKSYTKDIGYPDFLLPILKRAAQFGEFGLNMIEHAMITEYSPGTPIGW